MMNKVVFLLLLSLVILNFGCSHKQSSKVYRPDLSNPPSNPKEEPFALIMIGTVEAGNSILGTNFTEFLEIKVHKKINGNFVLANTEDKPSAFDNKMFGWVDKGFIDFAEYKIIAIDKSGKEHNIPTFILVSPEINNKLNNNNELNNDNIGARLTSEGKGYPYGTSGYGPSMKLTTISNDSTYGYTEKNPIKLGGFNAGLGSHRQQVYLNSIYGPNGQTIEYERVGSCCSYPTPNGVNGSGLLDLYKLSYNGIDEPIKIYISMYDEDYVFLPIGLTSK